MATEYKEGAFGIVSGTPYGVLEVLRKEGIGSSSRIIGVSRSPSDATSLCVMYYTGGKNILTNLINWFKFDSVSIGETTAIDCINLKTAKLVSGASLMGEGVGGTLSGALYLSGATANSKNHVTITAQDSDLIVSGGTVSVWVNTDINTGGGNNPLVSTNQSIYELAVGYNKYAQIYLDPTLVVKYVYRDHDAGTAFSATNVSISGSAVSPAVWNHVAVTSNGKNLNMYINGAKQSLTISGVDQGQFFGSIPDTSETYQRNIGIHIVSGVGAGGGLVQEYFSGRIDSLRVADFEMSEGQIIQLYDSKL